MSKPLHGVRAVQATTSGVMTTRFVRLDGVAMLVLDVVAAAFLLPLVVVDIRSRRLPDALTLGGAATLIALLGASALWSGDRAPLVAALTGAVVMAGVLLALHLASPAGMGFGDVKLGLLLGVVLGARSVGLVLPALLAAGLLGAVAGLVLMVRHRRRDVTLPFGPYLVAGTVLALLLGG